MCEKLDLTIVIPSHASSKTLKHCLRHIQLQKTTFHYKVMIIHSGNEPIDPLLINEFGEMCFYVVRERWLPSRARNWGLIHSNTEWLMFVDSDCLLDEGYIENMMSKVIRERIDGIGGCVRNANPKYLPGFVMHQLEFSEWAQTHAYFEAPNFPTCNSIYRRTLLNEMGGFPEVYPCEDTIMNLRLRQKGYKLMYFGNYGVGHIHQKSWQEVAKYNYLHGIAYGYTTHRYNVDGYQLHKLPIFSAVCLIVGGRFYRITKRIIRNKDNLLLWLLCSPYILICLCLWAIGFVNFHDFIDEEKEMSIADVERLDI